MLRNILHYAAEGCLVGVNTQINRRANCIDKCDDNGNTALMYAASNNHVDVAVSLLTANANVNTTNKAGHTALDFAIAQGNLKLSRILIKHKAVVHVSRFPLSDAINKKHRHMVPLLLQYGADVNASGHFSTATPLCAACLFDDVDMVRLLLSAGADVNSTTGYTSALGVAAINNNMNMMQVLLKHSDADVNIVDINGDTPLMQAVSRNHEEIVKLLLSHCANVNIGNAVGMTPLMIALAYEYTNIVKMLAPIADVGAVDELCRCAMFFATNDADADILLQHGFTGQRRPECDE